MNPEPGQYSKIPDRKLPESAAPVTHIPDASPPTMTESSFAGSTETQDIAKAEQGGPS
jgi:hypothetical protein